MTHTPPPLRGDATARPQGRRSAGWIALVAVIAALAAYFLLFTGEPEDATLTGNLPASTGAASDPGAVPPPPAPMN